MPGLFGLILFSTLNNLLGGVFMGLLDAYGLELVSVEVWGVLFGIASIGFIVGGAIIAKTGLGSRPLRTLLWACMAMWVVAALFTIRDSVWLLVAGYFLYMVLIPFIEAAEQTMLQRVVPLAKLEEEVVELVDQPLLQIALVKPSWFGDAEELEHVGVFEQVVG